MITGILTLDDGPQCCTLRTVVSWPEFREDVIQEFDVDRGNIDLSHDGMSFTMQWRCVKFQVGLDNEDGFYINVRTEFDGALFDMAEILDHY